ncbi:hypothetical protein CI109_106455 [Kwoniella shandongensis]|uniref:Uncharacterized protein n=1 Tax=Kwoniella shandongensis TaxID=1734106 RepID=A0A5M6C2L6_9TREE|nr:uncharacterized protein CI109_002637 [Kwoniella shandongensis]KAA5528880.1 hypothetical protein CI109_002637 [Kwoniella shandongensis]
MSPSVQPRTRSGPLVTSILGTGSALLYLHFPSLDTLPDQFKVHSIYERKESGRLDSLREGGKLEGVKIVRTLEEVVNDEEVELVVITTPNNTHYEFTKSALNANKHVLLEKPICPTLAEATELYELAEQKGLILGVYHNRRWDSDFLTMKGLLDSGKLGIPLELTSTFDRYRPLPSTYKRGANWKETPGESNSSIFNLGTHLIDQAVVLFGIPERVAGRCVDQRGIGMDESFVLDLFYPPTPPSSCPLTITVRASILSPLPHQLRYLLKCTKGSYVKYNLPASHPAIKDLGSPAIHEGFMIEPEAGWGTVYLAEEEKDGTGYKEEILPAVKGNYPALYANLLEAIDSGDRGKLIIRRDQVLAVLKIIELGVKSSDQGRVMKYE